MRVLIVEDEALVALELEELLLGESFEVMGSAANAAPAVKASCSPRRAGPPAQCGSSLLPRIAGRPPDVFTIYSAGSFTGPDGQLARRQGGLVHGQLHDPLADIVRNAVPDAIRPGRANVQGLWPAALIEIAPAIERGPRDAEFLQCCV